MKKFNINGNKITVKYSNDNYGCPNLPIWEAWITGNKEKTFKTFKGNCFNAVDENGNIYQEPRLVAEQFASNYME